MLKEEQRQVIGVLEKWFATRQKVAVAFSGGVDSSLLLFVGGQVLGRHCRGLFAKSPLMSKFQIDSARSFARSYDLDLEERLFAPLSLPGFIENRKDRCYICKKALYGDLSTSLAPDWQLADGTNLDDKPHERPGFQAIKELAVATPFLDCRIGKLQIREVSRSLGLPSWNRPSDSCLATRIARPATISLAGLRQVEQAEAGLRDLGFAGTRACPDHDKIVLTFKEGDLQRALLPDVRRNIEKKMLELSFSKVFLDLSERPGILP